MSWFAGILLALALLGACTLTAYPIAAFLTDRGRISYRWCGTAIVACWLLTSLFYVLTWASAFRLRVAVPLWLLLVLVHVAFRRRRYDRLLRQDLSRLWALGSRPLPPRLAWALCAVMGVVALRASRGLVAPPLAWDSLTYHLLKAGRWVQNGAWVSEAAPDAWSYYEYFPAGGDLLWAWAMLPVHSDALLGPAGVLVWLVCLLGGYGAAVSMRASRSDAVLTALAIAAMPSVVSFLTSGYVTTFVLAQFLLAFVFIPVVLDAGRLGHALLAAASLGMAAGAQVSALPLLGLGMVAVCVGVWRVRPARAAVGAVALSLVVCGVGLAGYFYTWIQTGSPLYPMAVSIGGRTIAAGNDQLAGVLSGQYLGLKQTDFLPLKFLAQMFYGSSFNPAWEHLNLGPGALVLMALGLAGVARQRNTERRGVTLLLLAMASIPIAGIMSDAMLSQRTMWAPVAGRFLTPAVAAFALLGTAVLGGLSAWLRTLAVLGGVAYAIPLGIGEADWLAMGRLVWFALPGVAIAFAIAAIGWRVRHLYTAIGLALVALLTVIAWGVHSTRTRFRYAIYESAASAAAYDLHPLFPAYVSAWPIWAQLDGERPYRIAFVAGWDGFGGHNWYRYPLLGSRLQNTVVYVPPTRDGRVLAFRRANHLLYHADSRVWIRRLIDQEIDVVVAAPADTVELSWMRDHPRVFASIARGADGRAQAFGFVAAEARLLLLAKP